MCSTSSWGPQAKGGSRAFPRESNSPPNTSPLRASRSAMTLPASVDPPIERARAARVDTPVAGVPVENDSPEAVATPIRMPVKVPGPFPTAIRSTSSHPPSTAAASPAASSNAWLWTGRPSGGRQSLKARRSPSVAATTVSSVAVSKPTTFIADTGNLADRQGRPTAHTRLEKH